MDPGLPISKQHTTKGPVVLCDRHQSGCASSFADEYHGVETMTRIETNSNKSTNIL